MKRLLSDIATRVAQPASFFIRRLRGTTAVRPLSESFYTLTLPGLDGEAVDLAQFAGRVTLVVNVASECGFTPQYAGLQRMHKEYAARGFAVLGFPSNEFGKQEPGSADEIRGFCDREYGVTFPLFSKVQTKSGPQQSPAYRRLGESGHLPAWNFYKFLVGRNGQVVGVFPTNVRPESRALRNAIERALSLPVRT
jgi:glutathione peroxidase